MRTLDWERVIPGHVRMQATPSVCSCVAATSLREGGMDVAILLDQSTHYEQSMATRAAGCRPYYTAKPFGVYFQ